MFCLSIRTSVMFALHCVSLLQPENFPLFEANKQTCFDVKLYNTQQRLYLKPFQLKILTNVTQSC